MKKQRAPKADVTIDNSTFNCAQGGVKMDGITADAVKSLATAVAANAKAISDITALVKGGDSYGLFVGAKNV